MTTTSPAVARRQLTRQNIGEIDDALDRAGIYAKGYWETTDAGLEVTGLRIGSGPNRLVAKFGDWIVRHADGSHSVRPDEPGLERLR